MRRPLRIALPVLALVLLLVAACAGLAYWQAQEIVGELQAGNKRAEVLGARKQLAQEPHRRLAPAAAEHARGVQTLLLIGSDHRWHDPGSAHSDTIILVRLDASRHRVPLLSIPRDLYVAIPGHGHSRINEAYADGGAPLLIRVVRETLGVKIDHFVEVNFAGFRRLVDVLGGVYLPVDQRYYNRNVGSAATDYADIDLRPGYQRLDGREALAFARFRHTDSDFFRAARQQLFIRAALHELLAGTHDPFALRDRAKAFAVATTSDISSLSELWWLYDAVRSVPRQTIAPATLPASDYVVYGADYVRASKQELRRAVSRFYGLAAGRKPAAHHATRGARHLAAAAHLQSDGGTGRSLLRGRSIRVCAPTALPEGYSWPASGAVRSYPLDGHPAVAAWASAGSGVSVLWMWTTWRDPPTLADPSGTVRRGGRSYEIWTAHGRIHQIAWTLGSTHAWITNTLRDALTSAQMLALARTCARVVR